SVTGVQTCALPISRMRSVVAGPLPGSTTTLATNSPSPSGPGSVTHAVTRSGASTVTCVHSVNPWLASTTAGSSHAGLKSGATVPGSGASAVSGGPGGSVSVNVPS